MMTREEFIEARMAEAKAKAAIEWERKNQKEYRVTEEGTNFALWVRDRVEQYAAKASVKMKNEGPPPRNYCHRDARSISNAVNAFILHLLRRNCAIGMQARTIAPEDIYKGEAIVDFVIDLCTSERWKCSPGNGTQEAQEAQEA